MHNVKTENAAEPDDWRGRGQGSFVSGHFNGPSLPPTGRHSDRARSEVAECGRGES